VREVDGNLATAFVAGYVVRGLRLVNHALELADPHQRIGQLLLAMLQMLAALAPPMFMFAPEAAEHGADLAAQLATRHGAPG
jgi:hypothetical protein